MRLFIDSSYIFLDKELDVKFCARVNKGNNEIAPSAELKDVISMIHLIVLIQ